MKKQNSIYLCFLFLFVFCLLSCEEDNEPYGPELSIIGLDLDVPSKQDTVKANEFRIYLNLQTDNEYATEYGVSSIYKTNISSIKVWVKNEGLHGISANSEISQFFLMDPEDKAYRNLFVSIDDFLKKPVLNSDCPTLFFTNQVSLTPRAESLVRDTLNLSFKVQLSVDNEKSFTQEFSRVLIP